MSTSSGLIAQYVAGKLNTDTTLLGLGFTRFYDGLAPDGTATPYAVSVDAGGVDTVGQGADAYVLTVQTWSLKVVDAAKSTIRAEQIANRIWKLLGNNANPIGTVAGGYVYAFQRKRVMNLAEVDDNITYQNIIQTFSVWVQEGQ